MAPTSSRLAAGVLCLSLATACTGSGTQGSARHGASDAEAKKGAEAAATDTAELRAGLTFLLTEHVFDVAATARELVRTKADLADRDVVEASAVLDANSMALASLVTRYAHGAHDAFLTGWRERADLLLKYAAAVILGDDGEAVRLTVALDHSATALSQHVHSFVLRLPARTVQDDLRQQTTSFMTALDALVEHRTGSAARLAQSASLMLPVAGLLATGIAADNSLR